jgi:hypothetical protein
MVIAPLPHSDRKNNSLRGKGMVLQGRRISVVGRLEIQSKKAADTGSAILQQR